MRVLSLFSCFCFLTEAYIPSIDFSSDVEIFESSSIEFGFERRKVAGSSADCLGAPFLYVTLHDEKRNVLKFSRDGCLISDRILVGGPNLDMNFRSMVINSNGDLIIANAADDVNQVLVFGSCSNTTVVEQLPRLEYDQNYTGNMRSDSPQLYSGQRMFKGLVTDVKSNRGAEHPYGLTLDDDQARVVTLVSTINSASVSSAFALPP